ncbi:ribonuclease H [Senna tora]|uniref:Ribonuclease H n=1 Tax=Senna tora TaxID=362788 RepID=A0A835CA27_9FABA|nr:ribonuclease H [Senna tora]
MKWSAFDYMECVEAKGKSGGLYLCWSKSIKLTVMDKSPNWIHAVGLDSNGDQFVLTVVYGPPKLHNRHKLWAFLESINENQLPWIIFGDFNQIKSANEKLSKCNTSRGSLEFNNTVNMLSLMEIPSKGAFILGQMVEQVKSIVEVLPISASDHAPLILNTHPINHRDDSMLFFKADITSCTAASNIWREFGLCSGLTLNLDKTEINFSPNTPCRFQKLLSETLNCRITDKFSKYLGAKIDSSAREKVQFQTIYSNLQDKLQSWKGKLLSIVGRLTLIKSVLTSMSLYHLSYYKLMKAEAMKCDSLLARFFWGSDRQRNKPHMLNWEAICKPINLGGLGVKSFSEFNQVVLAKQIWRIIAHSKTLLSQIMRAKCGTTDSAIGFKCPQTTSKQWKDIFSAKEVVLSHLKWQVGTGHDIPLNHAYWPTPTNSIDNSVNRVSDLVATNHRWNKALVHQVYDAPTAREILKIPISVTQGEDKIYWSGNNEGIYKVKDGYNKLFESRNISPNQFRFKAWKEYWKIKLPHKVLMFGWKLCHNRLPIVENLLKRNFNIQGTCVFGCDLLETQKHLFMECPAAKAVWFGVWFGSNIGIRIESVQCTSIQDWIQNLLSPNDTTIWAEDIHPNHIINLSNDMKMVWKLGMGEKEDMSVAANGKFRNEDVQDTNRLHTNNFGVYVCWKNNKRNKRRIWGSFYSADNGHQVPIIGMVAPSEEYLEGTMLKAIRETLQMLKNYHHQQVTIYMHHNPLVTKLNGHTAFNNFWGSVARDIYTLLREFTYFQCSFVDSIDNAPLNYLRGAQVGTYYNLNGL